MITWLQVHPLYGCIVIGAGTAAVITALILAVARLTRWVHGLRYAPRRKASARPADPVWGDVREHDTAWDLAVTEEAGHVSLAVPPRGSGPLNPAWDYHDAIERLWKSEESDVCGESCETMLHTGPIALVPLPEWRTTVPRHARAETIHLPPWDVPPSPVVVAEIREALVQVERGETEDLGSFARYLDDKRSWHGTFGAPDPCFPVRGPLTSGSPSQPDGEPHLIISPAEPPAVTVNILHVTTDQGTYSDDGWTTEDPSFDWVQQILNAPYIDGKLILEGAT